MLLKQPTTRKGVFLQERKVSLMSEQRLVDRAVGLERRKLIGSVGRRQSAQRLTCQLWEMIYSSIVDGVLEFMVRSPPTSVSNTWHICCFLQSSESSLPRQASHCWVYLTNSELKRRVFIWNILILNCIYIYIYYMHIYTSLCVCVCIWFWLLTEARGRYPWTRSYRQLWTAWYGNWKSNYKPLKEQQPILTT